MVSINQQHKTDDIVKKEGKELIFEDEKRQAKRVRSGTWGSQSAHKDNDVVKKVQNQKDKEIRRISNDRRQKRGE